MVGIPVRPTHQPAGAAWYRCVTPSVPSDTPMTLKNLYGFHKFTTGHRQPAKSLVPQTPGGLGAASHGVRIYALVLDVRRTVQREEPRRTLAPAIVFAVQIAAQLHISQSEGA